jgi:hypothetical protein
MIDASTQEQSSPPRSGTVAEVMRPALTTVERDAHLAAAEPTCWRWGRPRATTGVEASRDQRARIAVPPATVTS